MKLPLFLIVLTTLFLCACEKYDDVQPVTPVRNDSSAIVTKAEPVDTTKIPEEVTPSNNVDSASLDNSASPNNIDSALYKYAKFKDMPYRILFPKNYDAAKSYPVFIFLHGISERGTDNKRQLVWGASLFQTASVRNKHKAIIIFPQCAPSQYWVSDWGTKTLRGLIDTVIKSYKVDKDKIYIGGLSMGAYGTYAMVAQNPDLFAAAIAISGDGDEKKAPVMAKTKWRIFAGGRDNIVSSSKSEKMASALKKSGATVSLTIYPKADHTASWVNAFAEPDYCSWLFSVSRGGDVKH